MEFSVREGAAGDFSMVVAIQDASAELSAWSLESLGCVLEGRSDYGLMVAEAEGGVRGFLLWRALPEDETEVLSVAVDPAFRRQGAARRLLRELLTKRAGGCFLEVRESNVAAQELYRELGFTACGLRRAYYHRPVENAVLMRRTDIP